VLSTALSGIAATLFPEGQTLHSVFKIPLNTTSGEVAPSISN
jgi:hypothetical protein